jgi:hypothetical protein
MESFPVDIDPGQIVRWVMAEHKTASSNLKTVTTRATEVRELPTRGEYHLGEDERADLSEVATVAILQIAPAHGNDGWRLIITVEDEIGPQGSAYEAGPQAEQQIDLGTFYNEFIRPGRGTANVVAQVDSSAARRNVTHLLEAIERNRHAVAQATARGGT